MPNLPLPPVYTVKVDGLASSVTENDLKDLFAEHGIIFSVKIMPPNDRISKTFAYVNFYFKDDADIATVKMNGAWLNDCCISTKYIKEPTSPRTDYRPFTDCKYMASEEGCSPADGQPCPYRHKVVQSKKVCDDWLEKKCLNIKCNELHPPLQEKPKEIIPPAAAKPAEKRVSSNDSKLEEMCKCSICLDRVLEPKTLQCEHTFCKDCLNDLMKFAGGLPVLTCAMCNQVQNLAPGETVSSLKGSLAIRQLLDVLGQHDSERVNTIEELCHMPQCKRSVASYCINCDIYVCENCAGQHELLCSLHAVKFSDKLEFIAPYCEQHDCFEQFGCQDCAIPVCIYCKEYTHKNHALISINEFTGKFKEPLMGHINQIEEDKKMHTKYRNKTMSAASTKEKEKEFKKSVEQKKIVMLSQFLFMLDSAEKQVLNSFEDKHRKFKLECNARMKVSDEKIEDYDKVLENAKSLVKKSNIEVIHQAYKQRDQLKESIIKNKFPEHPQYPAFDVKWKGMNQHFQYNLFRVLSSSFGEAQVSCVEGSDNWETLDTISNFASIQLDMIQLNQYENAKEYVERNIHTFGLSGIPVQGNQEKKKNGAKKKKKDGKGTDDDVADKLNERLSPLDSKEKPQLSTDPKRMEPLIPSLYTQSSDDTADEKDKDENIEKENDENGPGSVDKMVEPTDATVGMQKNTRKRSKKNRKPKVKEEDSIDQSRSEIVVGGPRHMQNIGGQHPRHPVSSPDLISFDESNTEETFYDDGERDADWKVDECDDGEEGSADDEVPETSTISDRGNFRGRRSHKRGRGNNRGQRRGSCSDQQASNRGRGTGHVGPRGWHGPRGGTRGNRRGKNTVPNLPSGFSGNRGTQHTTQDPPSLFPGYTASRRSRGRQLGSYQRPSGASSVPNLFEGDMKCYKCGRNGHTVGNCNYKATADGRPIY